ncbi:TetR/AcrR family transcriptional regulator [Methylocella sp.]|uniref:TetR/AcrR family transcriptional regulator n=1 Tax=Methylocella sp. TaxID=1978226 RepID=UPI00378382E5
MPSAGRKYRASEKREQTRQQNSAEIQAAAWRVFCSVGLDGANVRDIVKQSGLSPGTFYNYFRTKEAIFEVVAQNLFERLREATRAARARARDVDELVVIAYSSYLEFLQATEGALEFTDRNQHHLRSQLYPSTAIAGILQDLEQDLRRFIGRDAMSDEDVFLFASMIIAAGAEAVFSATRLPGVGPGALLAFLTKFMLRGLGAWVGAAREPAAEAIAPRLYANDA